MPAVSRKTLRTAIAVLLVLGLSAIVYQLRVSFQAQKEKAVDRLTIQGMLPDAVQWIQNFHRIEVKDGKKAWEVEADEAQYLQDAQAVVVRRPKATFFTRDDDRVTLTGGQGRLQLDGSEIRKADLHENVEVHVRGFVVHALEATYDRAEDRIVARGQVTIEGRGLEVRGNDMVVFVKDSRFELQKDVKVTLRPKAAADERPS